VALLVAGQPSGDKFKYAQLWKVQCVTPQYVYDSVAAGVALPVNKYEIEARRASTPEKDEQFRELCFLARLLWLD